MNLLKLSVVWAAVLVACTVESSPPPSEPAGTDEPAVSATTSKLEVAPPITSEICPPCPLVHAKLALGEPVANLCSTSCENCGNGVCDNGETRQTCATDCPLSPPGSRCGNGRCETGESAASCPADCSSASCGNAICEAGERTTCRDDCCQFDDPPCPL
ncbi:MAG: hypothetical protein H7138_01395 [Myxococcales bacterium]|nr:hypothetical protein [Myxococcales bacterium]